MEVICEVCGSSSRTPLFKTKLMQGRGSTGGPLVRCMQCGMIYVNPRIVGRQRFGTNRKLGKPWIEDEAAHRAYWKRRLRDLERLAHCKGRLLDIGVIPGIFWMRHVQGVGKCMGLSRIPLQRNTAKKNFT